MLFFEGNSDSRRILGFGLILLFKSTFIAAQQLGPCPMPPDFPPNLKLTLEPFHSFSLEINIPYAYVFTPRNVQEIIFLSNWAYLADFRIRAIGAKHSWSPLIFAATDDGRICPKFILVETMKTKSLTSLKLNSPDYDRAELKSVTAGPGVTLRILLEFLEQHDLGLYSSPSSGSVTIGGMLSIGAHGSGISSDFDKKSIGHTYGSFSNLVLEMTIIAWNEDTRSYELKTITRSDTNTKAFLTNFGRTFITSVTIRVGKNQMLRSQSHFFIPVKEVFGHPNELRESSRSLSKFVESYGRINVIGLGTGRFSKLWIITWRSEPIKPQTSRRVFTPYNYYIMNYFPEFADPFLKNVMVRNPSWWKPISIIAHPFLAAATGLSKTLDYWGPSKNHLLYLTRYSPKQRPNSFAVVTSRENLQLVAHIMRSNYDRIALEFESSLNYPSMGEFNLRVSGLDDPNDVQVEGAESPSFSNSRPLPEYPHYDIIIWFEFSAYAETPTLQEFATRLQDSFYRDIHGKIGILRVEWSKGWGHTDFAPWTNTTILKHFSRILSSSDQLEEWNWAVDKLNENDPHMIFSNDFLDGLLRKY